MSHQQATILLVEDDQSLQEGIKDLLEVAEIGYDVTVISASDGVQGLEAMRTIIPDLIISDIMMPRMDGYAFLHAVRQQSEWVHVPFIFLTARGKKRDVRVGRASGAELYITKPFQGDVLIDLVQTQLDRTFIRVQAQQDNLLTFKRSVLQLLNHEFRTPLTYVTAYYEMLTDSLAVYEDTENLQAYLQGIYSGCVRLANLVEDLVLVMEIRTGAVGERFQREAVRVDDLGGMLRQVMTEVADDVAGVTFKMEVADDLPAVWGVPYFLRLVVTHLVKNAIKFLGYSLETEKWIELKAWTEKRMVYVAVSDNGIGIPSQVHKQVFDLFFQHNRDYYEQQGSGAGLSIVRGLVALHGGQVEVSSQPDEGASFTISLPVGNHRVDALAKREGVGGVPAHVLVVEDNHYLLEGLRELLELCDEPYFLNVSTAVDGVDALEKIRRREPDLIVSDIMMPNMNGYELLTAVREHSEWAQIPFIFLSAKGEEQDIHLGRQIGAEEYITKPYDSDELLELVNSKLARSFELASVSSKGFESLKQSILNLLQPSFSAPLNSVAGHSEMMAEALAQAETVDELTDSLRSIQQGSDQIAELVEEFILLAEIKTGEAENAFEVRGMTMPQVDTILYQAAQQRVGMASRLGIEIHEEREEGTAVGEVLVDYEGLLKGFERLVEAVLRLCRLGDGTAVYLASTVLPYAVQLKIWHNGRGLPDEQLAQVNDLFKHGDERIVDMLSYGPKLCIVRNYVHIHQGSMALTATETHPNQITITLPLHK